MARKNSTLHPMIVGGVEDNNMITEKYGGEAHDSHGTQSIGAGAGARTKEPELQGTLKGYEQITKRKIILFKV